jgi:hypothetical protein
VFSVGSELTLFMRGIVAGDTLAERLGSPDFRATVSSGAHNEPLGAFLAQASSAVRPVFGGRLTYASVPLEDVDWSLFDVIGLDLYREARLSGDRLTGLLRRYLSAGRPVAITESGCCTYRGAEQAGGRGWDIIDDTAMPPRLKGDYVRDEGVQATEVTDLLGIFDRAGADATFVFTFAAPLQVYSEDPRYDFDMASYSLVKSFGGRLGDPAANFPQLAQALPDLPWDLTRTGTAYPGLPWEPKQAVRAVAACYAAS